VLWFDWNGGNNTTWTTRYGQPCSLVLDVVHNIYRLTDNQGNLVEGKNRVWAETTCLARYREIRQTVSNQGDGQLDEEHREPDEHNDTNRAGDQQRYVL
jgi:hypothetical protein